MCIYTLLDHAKGINMKKEFQEFITLGYYICPITNTPEYLHNISKKFISVSECLCDHQPQLEFCAGVVPYGNNADYREKYQLTLNKYQMMSEQIERLFDKKLFDSDGRFLCKKDAVSFYKTYFNFPEIAFISLEIDKKNTNELGANFTYIQDEKEYDTLSISQEILGYDIIGWDIGGFHSFLCNNLHKEFNDIKFTPLGLLDMDYCKVASMAQMIQGRGEPVNWIPCKIVNIKV